MKKVKVQLPPQPPNGERTIIEVSEATAKQIVKVERGEAKLV